MRGAKYVGTIIGADITSSYSDEYRYGIRSLSTILIRPTRPGADILIKMFYFLILINSARSCALIRVIYKPRVRYFQR